MLSKISIVILILFTSTNLSFAATFSLRPGWSEYKSTHFIVYYRSNIPTSYIRAFSRKCEHYYRLITERLDLRRFNFWTWDNRARIVLYDSRENYTKYRRRPSWSEASVIPKKKLIYSYYLEQDFLDTTLPHELTHIILRELIGQGTKLPLWFEEGIACSNEQDYLSHLSLAKNNLDQGTYLTVALMDRIGSPKTLDKIGRLKSKEFPARFYSTSASLAIFLLEEYKRDNFFQLCRSIRDGNSFYKALNKIYDIKNAQDLQDKFLDFLLYK